MKAGWTATVSGLCPGTSPQNMDYEAENVAHMLKKSDEERGSQVSEHFYNTRYVLHRAV